MSLTSRPMPAEEAQAPRPRNSARAPEAPRAPVITVRRLAPSDSITELTDLLHRAYARQMAMGLRPLAGRQDESVTHQRVFSGECWVAIDHIPLPDVDDPQGVSVRTRHKLVGTILYHEVEEAEGPPWFHRPDVAWFSQLAVDPDYQGYGIGSLLLDAAERRALADGASELALSMAEPDTDLMHYYLKRGYRFIEHWQWPYTNYKSAILSKRLEGGGSK